MITKEVKRRANVVERSLSETLASKMVFGVLQVERLMWRRVGMRAEDVTWMEEAAKLLEQAPIRLV